MRPRGRSLKLIFVGVLTAAAVLAYASTGAVTAAVTTPNGHAQKLTRAGKLEKALKQCKKDKSKKQRSACERRGRELYGPEQHEATKNETTTTGYGTATTTGATTGAGTTGTAPLAPNIVAQLEHARTASETPTAAQVTAGKAVFEASCEVCHGAKGEGQVGDNNVPYRFLPRAQTVRGVIEQLVTPLGGAPEFELMTIEQKEQAADYVCVVLTQKCTEG
jgi:mono/diheme cytochrome c family protein